MTEPAGIEPGPHYCLTAYCTEELGHAGDCSGANLRAITQSARTLVHRGTPPVYLNLWAEDHVHEDGERVRYLVAGMVPQGVEPPPVRGLIIFRIPLAFIEIMPALQDMLSLLDPAQIRGLYPDAGSD